MVICSPPAVSLNGLVLFHVFAPRAGTQVGAYSIEYTSGGVMLMYIHTRLSPSDAPVQTNSVCQPWPWYTPQQEDPCEAKKKKVLPSRGGCYSKGSTTRVVESMKEGCIDVYFGRTNGKKKKHLARRLKGEKNKATLIETAEFSQKRPCVGACRSSLRRRD